jgi:hypothetical protein
MNILVFPCGSELGLELYRCLNNNKSFKLFGLSSVDDSGQIFYANYSKISADIGDRENLIDSMNYWVDKWEIDVIYPTMDSVIKVLNEEKSKIQVPFISQTEYYNIFVDKYLTYEYFAGFSFVPRYNDSLSKERDNEIFVKPRIGYGSRGTRMGTYEECRELNKYVYCEYLPGREITVDNFSINGDVLWSLPRLRRRTKFGISVETEYLTHNVVANFIKTISDRLNISGAWFAQFKEDRDGNFKLLEIAPRFGGSSGLSRIYGVSMPEASIYSINDNINFYTNNFQVPPRLVRQLDTRFVVKDHYQDVYVDYDDTLLLKNGSLSVPLFAWLLTQKEFGKNLFLITRHRGNLEQSLKKLSIYPFFEGIIWLKHDENKSNYISRNSIFIDDSFVERLEVSKLAHVLVLDPQTAVDVVWDA